MIPFILFIVILFCILEVPGAKSSSVPEDLSVSCAPDEVLQGIKKGNPICKKTAKLVPGVGSHRLRLFTSSGTWTNTGSISWVRIRVVGGGGGGYSGNPGDLYIPDLGGSGGGGGGYCETVVDVSKISSIPVIVGAGGVGAGVGPESANGGDGGASSFGAYCTATGGQGAKLIGSKNSPGTGGVGQGGNINLRGQGGISFIMNSTSSLSNVGGNVNGQGGSSALGAGGTAPGAEGELFGGGGAGGLGTPGGAGASGVVIVEEYGS